jgi:putative FmdB family regulatory protein
MPIYTYRCSKCGVKEELLIPFSDYGKGKITHCDVNMTRVLDLPQLCQVKKTGQEMALDMLNSHETDYMKPEHKEVASKGLHNFNKNLF